MTDAQKKYIDNNHDKEAVTVMARALCLTLTPVNAYMLQKGYKAVRFNVYKKDRTAVKEGFFDVDNF
jgi:hypothetical protein